MNYRSFLGTAFEVLIVVAVVGLVAGQFLGIPVLLSYVETGSMSPTMEAGDGFVAIPAEIAGPVEEGDVVTFQAQELHGGGLTTHRVVAVTDQGYVTQGDNNPATDQDGQEPYVTDGQVVAKALQIGDTVVVIPHLGTAVSAIQHGVESLQYGLAAMLGTDRVLESGGLAWLLVAAGLFTYAVAVLIDPGERERRRDVGRSRRRSHVYDAVGLLLLLGVFLAIVTGGTMMALSTTDTLEIHSVGYESDRPDVMEGGTTDEWNYTMQNDGLFPVVMVVEPGSDGVETSPTTARLERGEQLNSTVTVSAPPETGVYVRSVESHHYFAVLPHSTIVALHEVHPWLATGVLTGVIVTIFMLPVVFLFGTGTVRTRERKRDSATDWW